MTRFGWVLGFEPMLLVEGHRGFTTPIHTTGLQTTLFRGKLSFTNPATGRFLPPTDAGLVPGQRLQDRHGHPGLQPRGESAADDLRQLARLLRRLIGRIPTGSI